MRPDDVTYPEVGATSDVEMPAGYHHLEASRVLGIVDLDDVASVLMTWRMHRRAGLRLVSGPARVETGADVTFRFVGRTIPCRVVTVVDEVDRRGFAYGTLPGHPERGEERFVVERDPATGVVTARIRAFSRPGGLLTTALGPAGRWVQALMTRRYLDALAQGAGTTG